MGCVASKLEQEEEVVAILRERKNYMKLAVERRYALAEAQSRYNKSLFAVSAAIKLFVARHSSPTAPFLITFPDPESNPHPHQLPQPQGLENVVTNPMFLQQTPTEPAQKAIKAISCDQIESHSQPHSESEDESQELRVERDEHHHQLHQLHQNQFQQEQHMNGYYYMQMPPPMPVNSANGDFGWDYFNPFEEMRPEVMSEEDLKAVREKEGIPELEEEGESEEEASVDPKIGEGTLDPIVTEAVSNVDDCRGEQKGLAVIDTPEGGRELLDALRDIEDHFLRAYNSGKEVSRMLEASRIHLHSNLEEIKENSSKLLTIAWHRSTSSRPLSCQSLVASSSKRSLVLTEKKTDLNDDYEGMDSGSHSLTLERLYAWEKKLYEEVKAGDNTRKIYEKKCSQLKHHDGRGDDTLVTDRTRAAVKDLYARILVAIRSAESISRRIDKLRDEELQPQISELLQGLMQNWKVLLEAHETQNRILSEVKTFTCPVYGKFCSDSHRLATLQLQIELHSWRTCFVDYIAATMGYIEALYNWLAKFVATEVEVNTSKKRPSSTPVYHASGPPLLMIFHNWLESMKVLPDQSVSSAMKGFARDVRALWLRQGEELQQKRKVDNLAKEYERRLNSFERPMHNPVLAIKLTEDQFNEAELSENLSDKNDQIDTLRMRLDLEKEKHKKCMQETQHITLNGLQTGFCSVFDSLIHFSQASLKMYSNLVGINEPEKPSSVKDSHTLSEQEGRG